MHSFVLSASELGQQSHLCFIVQELGWYNPMTKDTNLKAPEIKRWLSVGAQPSETVEALLKKAMVISEDD